MSQGHHSDLERTKEEMIKSSGLIDGKNWLRHAGQAQRIDEMLLAGATVEEMAHDLIRTGLFTKGVDVAMKRVQRHIAHLRKEEHMLPLSQERNGLWRFNFEAANSYNIVGAGFHEESMDKDSFDDIKI